MSLTNILIFALFAVIFNFFIPRGWRKWSLMAASILAIYWMQPSTALRNFDFWFPTASIALTVFVWTVTCQPNQDSRRNTLTAAAGLSIVILLIGLTRYIDLLCCLTPTRPPDIARIALMIGLVTGAFLIPYVFLPRNRFLSTFTILVILSLFIILKSDFFARPASAFIRSQGGQPPELASILDLPWLGFSFLSFRLLHVLRDYQSGVLPVYSFGEFLTYAIFFPAFTAGPIDRSQRFSADFRGVTQQTQNQDSPLTPTNRFLGAKRILTGVFLKFVIADSLALFALNGNNALQVNSTIWAWVLLYTYSLRIYFDFSGYTDIALGLGLLLGFNLPENFDRPYLKFNLTSFWNSWHITLAQWFRAYYFNPVTRYLRKQGSLLPGWGIIFLGQFTTMVLIGLWHGITWNFAIWGAWHGLGLFVNNRWSLWTRTQFADRQSSPQFEKILKFGGWLLTFNFVSLGWVWFVLPSPQTAVDFFQRLFNFY